MLPSLTMQMHVSISQRVRDETDLLPWKCMLLDHGIHMTMLRGTFVAQTSLQMRCYIIVACGSHTTFLEGSQISSRS